MYVCVYIGHLGSPAVLEGTLEMAKTVIGTPYYMSPELFRNQVIVIYCNYTYDVI
jgi:serine/threonine protein kinase